ncbi:hypothetical protein NDU88_000514 [Pleurodeles waltl]|uniref:KRAB domain-containing protein n=1 Tax=Pleurodeles waltl TaxID=8319 RepID=A0AAV7N8B6_PLEWA|nr:hypothetical protein NDU88_000514 [Pleurodeles waltl]
MSYQKPDKALLTFQDVVACFSREEWELLQKWQKDLYANLMKEIHQVLLSLGPVIATCVFSLRAKGKEGLEPAGGEDSSRWHSIPISEKDAFTVSRKDAWCGQNPLGTDSRENLHLTGTNRRDSLDLCGTYARESHNLLVTDRGESPDALRREGSPLLSADTMENSDPLSTEEEFTTVIISDSIKEEGVTYPIVDQNLEEAKNIYCPLGISNISSLKSSNIKEKAEASGNIQDSEMKEIICNFPDKSKKVISKLSTICMLSESGQGLRFSE